MKDNVLRGLQTLYAMQFMGGQGSDIYIYIYIYKE